jgi:radical SAM protein with 4Fe4S-binding SPASM domain
LHAVKLLRERNIPVQLKATWMKTNWREKDLIMKIVEDYDTTFRSGSMLIHCRDGDERPTELLIPSEDLKEMHRISFEKRPKEKQKLPPEPEPVPEEVRKKTYPCGVGHTSLNIDSCGNIYPCAAMRIKLGNIRTDRIADIWKKSQVLERIRKVTLDDLEDCRECALWTRCNRCAGLAHQETGSYTARSPQACEFAEATKKFYDEKKCEIE